VIARAFSFEVGLQFVVVRATLLRADPAHPGDMVGVAASEKVARYISKLDIDSSIALYLQFVVVRATLLRADSAHPGGMAGVAASEKVARYISKLDIDSSIALYTMALKVTWYLER
jgi:hypothetical protein